MTAAYTSITQEDPVVLMQSMIEALKFYAAPSSWQEGGCEGAAHQDRGSKARQVLLEMTNYQQASRHIAAMAVPFPVIADFSHG